MQSKNLGFLIYTKPIKDFDLFIKVLSSNDIIINGIVYGGNSSKKKIIYQPGYFIEYIQFKKNINNLNSINAEIVEPYISNIFNEKIKLFGLLSIISLLNRSLYEGAKVNGIFDSVKNLIYWINNNQKWILSYCKWLLFFLELLGYGIEYLNNDNMKYFNLSSLSFQNNNSHNSVLFPYEIFDEADNLNKKGVESLFTIFETVFINNHLNIYKNEMPKNYINFKNLVLEKNN